MVQIIRQSPLFSIKKNQSRQFPPPEQSFQFFEDMIVFDDFSHFEGTEGGRRSGVEYIMRVSPKTILKTGKGCRSLSHTILDFYFLLCEVMRAILPNLLP
jgi:hypothetical protein